MYFCYAYNLGIYLVWFPKYLNDHLGFSLRETGLRKPAAAGRYDWRRIGRLDVRRLCKALGRFKGRSPCSGIDGLCRLRGIHGVGVPHSHPISSVLYSCLPCSRSN